MLSYHVLGTCSHRKAAVVAQRPPERLRSALTAYGLKHPDSTLSTLERYQRPVQVSSGIFVHVLDAPSASDEGTVVWNIIRTHKRFRNTCNVKSGRFPVHLVLGLDHASYIHVHARPVDCCC